jgi:tRNA A-37 threonylcarbamoyl transferase component Bud32
MNNIQEIYYIKENVSRQEYEMQTYVYNSGFVNVPKIIDYDIETKQMKMVRVGVMNISDFYGEKSEDISDDLFVRIRNIIKTLYENNILYIDITGYNFIESDDKIWIIDFEHASHIFPTQITKNTFVEKFLNGFNGWNPEFA